MFCPNHSHNRRRLFQAAGTDRYQKILSTGKGIRAVARWIMSEGLVLRFSLAKEQIDRAEGRARETMTTATTVPRGGSGARVKG